MQHSEQLLAGEETIGNHADEKWRDERGNRRCTVGQTNLRIAEA